MNTAKSLLSLLLVALFVIPSFAQDEAKKDVEFLGTNDSYPFSEAVRAGNLLFLSGQLGYDSEAAALVEGGIQPETKRTLENISETLGKYGATMNDVVKCTVMMADIAEWPAMNEVYATFFPENKPARSAFAGSGLALGARVEIECIAAL
jgi:2-iminobutanoate/2-iminopropanoate deaminase